MTSDFSMRGCSPAQGWTSITAPPAHPNQTEPSLHEYGLDPAQCEELCQLRATQQAIKTERDRIQQNASQTAFQIGAWLSVLAVIYFYSSSGWWDTFYSAITVAPWWVTMVFAWVMLFGIGVSYIIGGIVFGGMVAWILSCVILLLAPSSRPTEENRIKLEKLGEHELAVRSWKNQLRNQDIEVIVAFGTSLEKLKDFSPTQMPTERNLPCSITQLMQAIERLSTDNDLPQSRRDALPAAKSLLAIYNSAENAPLSNSRT